jgi:acyl-CoA reductase-like NAD-dependent aldehyde dehydrogenase
MPISRVLAYYRKYWRTFVTMILAPAIVATVTYGYLIWGVSAGMRTQGLSLQTAATVFMPIYFLTSVTVSFIAAMIARQLKSAGRSDCVFLTILGALAITTLPIVAGPLAQNPRIFLFLVAPALGILSGTMFLAQTAIQTLVPNQMRGQTVGLSNLVVNLLGYGLGSMAVALLTDNVFKDEHQLHYSLSIVSAVCLLIAISLFVWGLPHIRSMAADMGGLNTEHAKSTRLHTEIPRSNRSTERMDENAPTAKHFIAGHSIPPESWTEIRDPSDRTRIVGMAARGGIPHLSAAVEAAKGALSDWAAMSPIERATQIKAGLESISPDAAGLARLYTMESGKPLYVSNIELSMIVQRGIHTLSHARHLQDEEIFESEKIVSRVRKLPFGVTACIIPWNSPVALGFGQVVAALLCGNTVIAKPPATCPLALSLALSRLAGNLPPGVLNVLLGSRQDIGSALVSHPDVEKIVFTGSTEGGRQIIQSSAQTVKDLTLELGGNDAAIILDDFDCSNEALVRGLVASAFQNSGQVCMAIKRLYVPESLSKKMIDALVEGAQTVIRLGNGLAEGVTIGPVHLDDTVRRVRELGEDAAACGGRRIEMGIVDPSADFENGSFVTPEIVVNPADSCRLVSEEQFAPILPVLTYSSEQEALTRANMSEFGLGGSVWGTDTERAAKLAWQVEAGTVWVNGHGPLHLHPDAPYGGIKQSGKGRKSGRAGLSEYYITRTLSIAGS